MSEVIFEDDDSREDIEEILFDMSTDDFIDNEIREQISDNIFSDNKRNYVEFYIEKFKFLKELYKENNQYDKLEELKDNKELFITQITNLISDTFKIDIDQDSINNKMTKSLYSFFVVDYSEHLQNFFINYILKNKKNIISEIKKNKSKVRDIAAIAAKSKFANSTDAIIINNINFVLFDLIPSVELGEDFIKYITDYDDDIINDNLIKFMDDDSITITDDTRKSFLEPFLDQSDGYTNVVSNIIIQLTKDIKQIDVNILFNSEDIESEDK